MVGWRIYNWLLVLTISCTSVQASILRINSNVADAPALVDTEGHETNYSGECENDRRRF